MIDSKEKRSAKAIRMQEPLVKQMVMRRLIDNKWGYIDKSGKMVIKPKYMKRKKLC